MEDISRWDVNYLNTVIVPHVESDEIEKKGWESLFPNGAATPNQAAKDELAKQVSAFSNSVSGFLVYGIDDHGALDAGVRMSVGNQSTKDWVESIIPTLLLPTVVTCNARLIQVPSVHAADRAVLVVSIQLSERRPHWVLNPREVAYVRAGAHSLPMRLQMVLDIASRAGGGTAEIVRVVQSQGVRPASTANTYRLFPYIRLLNGRLCERWSLELRPLGAQVTFGQQQAGPNLAVRESNEKYLHVVSTEPLFPGRETRALSAPIEVVWYRRNGQDTDIALEATLYLDSGFKAQRTFSLIEIDPGFVAHALVAGDS